MSDNSKQTIITAVSVVVALGSIAYALMTKVEKPTTMTASVPSIEVSDVTYEAGADNPVVMELNGRKVTRMAIMDNFAASGSQLPEGANIEKMFPLLQDQYLVGALLKKAALDNGFTKDTPEVAVRLSAALDQALRAEYIKSAGEESVTDSDIKKAYENIVQNAPAVEERRARHILLADEEKAVELIAALNAGGDFEALAKENSEGPTGAKGGDLGYFAKSEMVPEFADAAFAIEVGSVSAKPVQTQFGFHIIKVEDKRERAKPSFDEMKDQIENQLRQGVITEKLQELRQASEIKMYSYSGGELPKAKVEETAPKTEEVKPAEAE